MEMELRKKDPVGLSRNFNRMLVIAVVLWTAICAGSLAYHIFDSKRHITYLAHETALESVEKDLLYRFWAAGNGGVYVPVTETTKPNPHLSHLKERDITTPSGRRLTLMNPDHMTRQVHELGRTFTDVQGHITSLRPLRPENAPDAWEAQALRTIEAGAGEFGEVTNYGGVPHYRLMYPLHIVKPCLTCHEAQGYRLGELRGGISASIPMKTFASVSADHVVSEAMHFGGIWMLGLVGATLVIPFVRRIVKEREMAEETLRRNWEFTQSIIENEPECVKILGAGGVVKFMNRAGLAMIGAESIDEVLGQPIQQLVALEHREVFARLNEQVFAGENGSLEFEIVGLKGTRRWLETHAVPMKDKAENVESLLGITRDVTERRRAEQALSASEEQYRNLVDRSPDAIYVHVDGRIVFSNAMGVRLLGAQRPEDLYGRLFMEFVHPAYRNVIGDSSSRESDSAQASLREGVFLRVDGSGVDVEVTAMPFLFSRMAAVQVVARDISKRKEIERMLRKADAQYRVIVDTAHEGIIANDGTGIITLVNPRLLEMLGYSYEELLGRSIFEFMDDEEQREHEKQLELQRQGIVTQYERRFRRKDGSVIWTHASAAPLVDEQGVSRGGFGMFSDITDRKHAEEHRKKLEDQLLQSQKIESIGRLAGGIAHDINNMLTPILGYAELMEFNIPAEDPSREDLKEITNAAARIREMTQQLLAFSRRQTLDMRSLDVNVVISKFGKMLRRTLRENITISMNLVPSIGAVLADERQIEQVLLNLAVNAQDALPASGLLVIATKDVFVDAAFAEARPGLTPGRYVVITVSDNGMGMDGETLSRIFEPFFTTKESGRGTGLGLAMVYGIIKQHKGYVDVMSEPGGGTTFSLYLPVTGEATEDVQVAEWADIQKGTETILLVEDQSDVLEIVRQLLVTLGYRVLTAADGSSARAALGAEPGPVELMITDVIMPGINGRELYEELKRTRPALKVIYMSGYSSAVISTHGVLDSGVTLIRKPFSIQEISAKVRQVLDD
jgi:PAS domain S-box-containing protein